VAANVGLSVAIKRITLSVITPSAVMPRVMAPQGYHHFICQQLCFVWIGSLSISFFPNVETFVMEGLKSDSADKKNFSSATHISSFFRRHHPVPPVGWIQTLKLRIISWLHYQLSTFSLYILSYAARVVSEVTQCR
jgi:hypothetical protein